ncbi:MAG: phytanoyl-CoA dioxygenase family protein [Abitibacteriaceae bacterium]|nr:phytanoyl-CoA dioxygenase family protein [Abditibacteriaceae bacterium]MBV9864590.1 phytanoyl-CoA dioxygenase family protein [Abditibacteriaceae bacterium]
MDKQYLLTSVQMANFVADGMLRFDEFIPAEINAEAMREIDEGRVKMGYEEQGQPLANLWQDSKGFGAMIRLPQVQGLIQSLVGPNPLYDHHAFHRVGPAHIEGQTWHADAIIDTRQHFDIQLFYYPHDTPREMGGTMFLPGSHLRRIHESDIGRYHNFISQMPIVCKAGTLVVGHHGMWHCAQPNHTDQMRYMFKLRLNPTVRQLRLWNTDDINDAEIDRILFRNHKWYGNEDRLEYANRIKFWRFLTGNERFDSNYWLTRIENMPERVVAVAAL